MQNNQDFQKDILNRAKAHVDDSELQRKRNLKKKKEELIQNISSVNEQMEEVVIKGNVDEVTAKSKILSELKLELSAIELCFDACGADENLKIIDYEGLSDLEKEVWSYYRLLIQKEKDKIKPLLVKMGKIKTAIISLDSDCMRLIQSIEHLKHSYCTTPSRCHFTDNSDEYKALKVLHQYVS